MGAVRFYLQDVETGMYYTGFRKSVSIYGNGGIQPKWTSNITEAFGYMRVGPMERMMKRLSRNLRVITVKDGSAVTNFQKDILAYQQARSFLKELNQYRDTLKIQEMRTLKGQALSGDVNGATKGLAKLLAQKGGRAW